MLLAIVGGFALLLVVFVILEGRRQERKYGKSSERPGLTGVGMLELQRHLQADRQVEIVMKQTKKEDVEVTTPESADGKE